MDGKKKTVMKFNVEVKDMDKNVKELQVGLKGMKVADNVDV